MWPADRSANQGRMYHLGLVALGGGIGAGCRHLVNLGALRLFGPGFPAGTLIVNVVGGLLMGLMAGYFAFRYEGGGQELRLFLTTGVLGGFTTFSAFSLDVALLVERHSYALAAGYVLGSVGLALAGLFLGLAAFRHVPHLP